jgi:RNA polymerase sigma-70 factor (ECF subfamily)
LADEQDTEDDARLVTSTRRGDANAYATLLRRHFDTAYAVAFRLTGLAQDAEDACQEAFARAYFRLDECTQPSRFAGWLMQIVRHHAHNVRRYQALRSAASLTSDMPVASSDDPAADAARADLAAALRDGLAALTDVKRAVVIGHDVEGWTHPQIAAKLGISVFMSRRHLAEARAQLRARLGPAWRDDETVTQGDTDE